jgi:hypothetical protein
MRVGSLKARPINACDSSEQDGSVSDSSAKGADAILAVRNRDHPGAAGEANCRFDTNDSIRGCRTEDRAIRLGA